MATPAEWANGYARQADADFKTWAALQTTSAAAECHRLLFLQMACEKLCKAHLIRGGTPPDGALQSSHGYIAGPLPTVIKSQIVFLRKNVAGMGGVMQLIRHLANEIEVLNPAVDRAGQRPDNCEYPWEDANGVLHSPLTATFAPSSLLVVPAGRTFLKLLQGALARALEDG